MDVLIRPGDVRDAAAIVAQVRTKAATWLRADHETIRQRRFRGDAWYSGGFYVVASVGPTRKIRPSPAISLASEAGAWTSAGWPSLFNVTPSISSSDVVRFEARGADDQIDVAVEIRANGLVETLTRLSPQDREGRPYLRLVDVLRPIARLATVVEELPFARQRITRRRRDWYINLTPYQARHDGAVCWEGLILPGLNSIRRASDARPVAPTNGVAVRALSAWTSRRPVVPLLAAVATDLLVQNGYVDVGSVPMEAAREALETPIEERASSSGYL